MADHDHVHSYGQLDAVDRFLTTTGGASTIHAAVTLSQSYRTGVDDLWDACTAPERLARWFTPVSGDLRLGGRYQIEGNASGTIETCTDRRDSPRPGNTTGTPLTSMSSSKQRATTVRASP